MPAREATLEHSPSFPARRFGIGLVGTGHIARVGHLPAYARYGVNVVAAYNRSEERARQVAAEFAIPRVHATLDELLADPDVDVVDVATSPDVRPELVRRALRAGKHVLAQKPLAHDLAAAADVVDEAERRGLRLAVNQNGRWAPAWRVATLLVQRGAIGHVSSVTHVLDKDYSFAIGTRADELAHFLIYDYCVHWIDIVRCWLDGKTPVAVRAREYRVPTQPAESKARWGGWIDIAYADGTSALIRSLGAATSSPSCRFWIHGSDGVIRGSILGDDYVELERRGERTRYALAGSWFVDAFAGSMGELLTAVAEEREPYHAARHNLLSLELTLAACRSSEEDGAAVTLAH